MIFKRMTGVIPEATEERMLVFMFMFMRGLFSSFGLLSKKIKGEKTCTKVIR